MILGQETWTRRRYNASSIGTDGRMIAATFSDSSISVSVQNASGNDSQLLEEGFRTKELLRFYTVTDINTEDQRLGFKADELIDPSGKTYKAMNVRRYRKVIPHYKIIAVRVAE